MMIFLNQFSTSTSFAIRVTVAGASPSSPIPGVVVTVIFEYCDVGADDMVVDVCSDETSSMEVRLSSVISSCTALSVTMVMTFWSAPGTTST